MGNEDIRHDDTNAGGGFAEEDYQALLPEAGVEPTPRWVRAELGGRLIADSKRALLHLAYGPPILADDPAPLLPTYFFPTSDVDLDVLEPVEAREGRQWWSATVGDSTVEHAAWAYLDPAGPTADLADHLTFRWDAMDAWYEEAEEVFVHARDPYKRVDVLESSRHVEVALGGQVLASSHRPFLLFETHLPTRYYLPPEDVNMDVLVPTDTVSGCPYKGNARYWSLGGAGEAGRDIAWSYPDPIPEQPKLRGLVCFYNEKVDLTVDGQLQERPRTPWS